MNQPSGSKPKLSFGFKAAAKPAAPPPLAAAKPKAFQALADDDDDDDDGSSSNASSSARNKPKAKHATGHLNMMGLAPRKSSTPASRNDRKKHAEAEQLDATVFDYDTVYDSIKEAEKRVKLAKQQESAERKPKYIGNFLKSAEQRKRDRERAEAKMIQKEREVEGDEFADKEAFVTTAYKAQQEEIAQAEADEQRKEEEERSKSKGIGSFYRDMLKDSTAAREAAIAVSLQPKKEAEIQQALKGATTDVSTDEAPKPKSDAELALEAKQKGLNVELNDENQVVDKRDLLSKGLNVVSKRRHHGPQDVTTKEQDRESRQQRDQRRKEEYESRMNRDAQRSRQSALIEEQMLELERKRKREEEQDRERERQKVNAKRNDEGSISSARQRYLERKKQKLAGAGQGAADASPS